MEMDEDMELEQMVFEVREIDLEYEFDAARWYDFTRGESPPESQAAELWFHSAPSYSPSPFVTKLLLRDDVSDDNKTEEEEEEEEDAYETNREVSVSHHHHHPNYLATDSRNGMASRVIFSQQVSNSNLKKLPNKPISKGPTFSNHKHVDKPRYRPKSSIRPSSTLMKPTASVLAKQNNACISRFHMQVDQIPEKGLCGNEVQAAKRQKLDGGLLLRKVADTKQETSFVHKIPKKVNNTDTTHLQHTRKKITIAHEPDFATSQRANRIRQKNDAKLEPETAAVYRFKARPFNRKIFDAPSLPIRKKSTPKLPEFQEFHLKTSERAMQHSSSVTTRTNQAPDKSNRTDVVDMKPHMDVSNNISEGKHVFKARPLNKKILSSRGDMGVFKNSKRETTVPLEFNFHSEKRVQPDLPTDLFSKLSIKSELQPNKGSNTRFHQPKVSKENRVNSFQVNELSRMQFGNSRNVL